MEDLEQFNLTLNSVCIQWKQPYMCYNGMNRFLYHVTMEAIDLNEANTIMISEMDYCFPIDLCGSYMVTVTPSVESYSGTMKSLLVNGVGGKFS